MLLQYPQLSGICTRMAFDTRWFKDRLADQQMSQRALARTLGLDAAAVSLMLRGKRQMKISEAAAIARLLGVPADEVMAHAGGRVSNGGKSIPIVGCINGAGEGELYPRRKHEMIQHPGANLPEAVNAVECKTAGSPLEHMDGWILYVTDPREGVAADAVGRLSICKLRNGVLYLAAPHRGRVRGKWDLTGPATTARGVELEFALPVLLILP